MIKTIINYIITDIIYSYESTIKREKIEIVILNLVQDLLFLLNLQMPTCHLALTEAGGAA